MEELHVIKRERYFPALPTGSEDCPLNPIPNFTEGKIYDIYEEVRQSNFRPPCSGIRCEVKDDVGNIRFVSCEYFHKDPVLLWDHDTERRLEIAAERSTAICDLQPEFWTKVKDTMEKMDKAAQGDIDHNAMLDVREEHSKCACNYAGIPAKSISTNRTPPCLLEEVAEFDANAGLAETKILAGLKRNKNSFEIIDELITSLERQMNSLNGNLLTLRVEVQMLKKLALYK